MLVPVLLSTLLAAQSISGDPVQHIVTGAADTVAVTSAGSGPAVVIIPGYLGSAFGFRKVTAPLVKAGYRVLVVDLLGTGWSSRSPGPDYSLSAQARRVSAVLDSLSVKEALLVCHSIGASVGFRLALDRPGLVSGIVSINGGAAEQAETPGLRAALAVAPVLKLLGAKGLARDKMREQLRQKSADSSWVTDRVMKGYTAPFHGDLFNAMAGFRALADAHDTIPLQPRLHQLDLPVRLLVGSISPSPLPTTQIQTLATALPDLRVDTVPEAGLYIQEEKPGAVVAEVLKLEKRLRAVQPGEPARSARAGGEGRGSLRIVPAGT